MNFNFFSLAFSFSLIEIHIYVDQTYKQIEKKYILHSHLFFSYLKQFLLYEKNLKQQRQQQQKKREIEI